MYRYILAAALAATATFANAQTRPDTATLDLGRFGINKNFTQTITIKGSDLQQMPFTNLAEAINVWLYGAYTNANTLVYVVDGLRLNDVNAYSVYDIEEITLVQDAAARIAGTTGPQQLVLITTKRHKGTGAGIEVAGQASSISLMGDREKTNKLNLYQQYYLSAYKNTGTLQAGISANYQRDLLPAGATDSFTPNPFPGLNRFRFNGYFTAALGTNHVLSVNASYAPQRMKEGYNGSPSYGLQEYHLRTNDRLFNGQLQLASRLPAGFTNVFKAGYNHQNNNAEQYSFIRLAYNSSTYLYNYLTRNKGELISITDQLAYTAYVNGWEIKPGIAVSYNHNRYDQVADYNQTVNGNYQQNTLDYEVKAHYELLNPSLSVGYKDFFNLQVGAMAVLNKINTEPGSNNNDSPKRWYPYLTGGVNLAPLLTASPTLSSFKILGSYAWSAQLPDQTLGLDFFSLLPATNSYANSNYSTFDLATERYFKTLTAGTAIGFLQDRLLFDYNFQRSVYDQIYTLPYVDYYGNNNSTSILGNTLNYTHRLALNYSLINQNGTRLTTGLNATLSRYFPIATSDPSVNQNKAWTGGFVNRLQAGSFIGGIDVLYAFNTLGLSGNEFVLKNSVRVQNLFAGIQLNSSFARELQLYAQVRNLNNSSYNIFADYRRYIGIGFKAGF